MGYTRIRVQSNSKTEMIDISSQVKKVVGEENIESGMCVVYCPHTTAGITINEAADPSVRKDIISELNKIVPFEDGYSHLEGNAAAHIKASVIGESVTVPVEDGALTLGTWQGIFFCEFDGPRRRSVCLTTIK